MSLEELEWKKKNPDQGLELELFSYFNRFEEKELDKLITPEMKVILPGIEKWEKFDKVNVVSKRVISLYQLNRSYDLPTHYAAEEVVKELAKELSLPLDQKEKLTKIFELYGLRSSRKS